MQFCQTHHLHFVFCRCLHFSSLVGGNNLVDPTAQIGDTGVHGGGAHIAVRGAPGDNTNKRPHPAVLTDERATGVTLEMSKPQHMLEPHTSALF